MIAEETCASHALSSAKIMADFAEPSFNPGRNEARRPRPEGWGEAVDGARHANEALAVGGVESLIDHHGPGDAGRAGRPVRAAKRITCLPDPRSGCLPCERRAPPSPPPQDAGSPAGNPKPRFLRPIVAGRLKVKTPLTAS
jgi:hypothetical protein